jgi:hypothetical protein
MTQPPDTDLHLIARVTDPSDGAGVGHSLPRSTGPSSYRLARRQGLQLPTPRIWPSRSSCRSLEQSTDGRRAGTAAVSGLAVSDQPQCDPERDHAPPPDAASGSTTEWSLLAEQPAEQAHSNAELLREGVAKRSAGRRRRIGRSSAATWKLFWENRRRRPQHERWSLTPKVDSEAPSTWLAGGSCGD